MNQRETRKPADVLVSVAIPAYNAAATIGETIDSLLAQTHGRLEIVVVDDGSTDGTWAVLERYGEAIRPIRQPNSGIGVARNTGVRAARGEFIALLDADDICEPERIEIELRCLLDRPDVLLCSSDFSAFDDNGEISASYCGTYYSRCSEKFGGVRARYPDHGTMPATAEAAPGGDAIPVYSGSVYEDLVGGNFVHPPTVMFRKEALARAGEFDPDIRIVCEWEWFVRVARCGSIAFIDRPLLRYRRSPGQISSDPRTAVDAFAVARGIYDADPTLTARDPARVRQHLGRLSLSAADALAWTQPLRALRLLSTSAFQYRCLTRRSLKVLLKIVAPRFLRRGGRRPARRVASI